MHTILILIFNLQINFYDRQSRCHVVTFPFFVPVHFRFHFNDHFFFSRAVFRFRVFAHSFVLKACTPPQVHGTARSFSTEVTENSH